MDVRPKRQSLPDQVTQLLRDGIVAGRWRGTLPSESELVREFKVSRVTLRKALDQLTHEQWLASAGRGRHHTILHQQGSPVPVSNPKLIRLLSRIPMEATAMVTQIIWNTLREDLSTAGFQIRFEVHPELFKHPRESDLKNLLNQSDAGAWVLYRAPAAMQAWFAQQNTACLVTGCIERPGSMAYVEFDYSGVSRHAAGLFYQRGHRHMAFLCSEPLSVSDELSAQCFVEEARRLGADARVVTFAQNLSSIRRALDLALASRPQPTAFFTARSELALAALTYFQQAKLRVPQDVAIISRVHDQHLNFTMPTIAHYHLDGVRFGHKAAHMLLDMLEHGHGKHPHARITPHFIPGDSL